jgi:hypothetical protein
MDEFSARSSWCFCQYGCSDRFGYRHNDHNLHTVYRLCGHRRYDSEWYAGSYNGRFFGMQRQFNLIE